jgi:serine/threonine-protein kinase
LQLSPGFRLGPYEIQAAVGAGGMGEVYRARDTRLNRTVAIKVLLAALGRAPDVRARFGREARAISALNHPHICTLYDVGQEEGVDYLVMEFLDGEPLNRRIGRQPIPIDELLELGIDIADALEVAHASGILHRDLKPANLFVTSRGQVKILDFGVAKIDVTGMGAPAAAGLAATHLQEELVTGVSQTVGTVAYMSPEQSRGDLVDARSDLFSFGTVLYEMATGHRAFDGPTSAVIFDKILNRAPVSVRELGPGFPVDLERVIGRCLEKSVTARYQRARDVLDDLRAVKRRRDSGSGPVSAAARAMPSVAVLAFVDMSPQKDQDYFCEGMAEELINVLTSVPGIRVASRTSAFQFKGKAADISEIGARLRVESVLEGSVRKAGNRLRITAQLVNASDGYHLWSERYDREAEDIFGVQDEIARAIVTKLTEKLGGQAPVPHVKRPTEDLDAYHLYLQGRYYWARRGGFLTRAVECFQQAIARDASYAQAYAGLADAYGVLGIYGLITPAEAARQAKPAAARAVALGDALAETHRSMAAYKVSFEWDLAGAEREYRRALELGAKSGELYAIYAYCLAYLQRRDESLAASERARALEPESVLVASYCAVNLMFARRYDEALAECERCLALDPGFATAEWIRSHVLTLAGRPSLAVAAAERSVALTNRQSFSLAGLGTAYAAAGRRADADRVIQELIDRSQTGYVSPLWFADIATQLGEPERALEWLERAFESRTPALICVGISPLYASLHADPRFQALLARIGVAPAPSC